MGGNSKAWWLCTDFTDSWTDGSSRTGSVEDAPLKRQADSAFAHAEYRISNHVNKFDRIDAILALKRAMQTRLDHLDEIYNLKQYPQSRSVGWLGLLESWGVIRQRMLRRMRALRNAVEHDGAEPPTFEECQDYCEVAWWFLRGTTPLLTPMTDMYLYFDEGELSLDLDYNPVKITATGAIWPEMLSDAEVSGWTKIETRFDERSGRMTPHDAAGDGTLYVSFVNSDPDCVLPFLRMAFRELL
ncbi:hypothetical protein ACFWZY_30860 [Streptomyces sp. NPDC058992]|uniref:hypothetical protein n=1 Tax=Streptomyces sp. NPDC058992 TaxID=3346688 RepID=UPI0036A687CE